MPATNNLVELRELLSRRFPQVRMNLARPTLADVWPTGVLALDHALGGGLPRGEFTELVAPKESAGSAQVIHALLRRVAAEGRFLALVDGRDSFDAGAEVQDTLSRLLWVRCAHAHEAFKAADLLLRDRNISLVVFDLKLNPATELRKAAATAVWHRFSRLLEQNQTTVLVVTPFALVSGAACRVRLESVLGPEALGTSPEKLLVELRFTLLRPKATSSDESAAQAG